MDGLNSSGETDTLVNFISRTRNIAGFFEQGDEMAGRPAEGVSGTTLQGSRDLAGDGGHRARSPSLFFTFSFPTAFSLLLAPPIVGGRKDGEERR